MTFSLRKLAGLGATAMMAISMTTVTGFADESTAPQVTPPAPPTCTTVVHSNPDSKAACPPADPADPAGLSHTMTGGSFTSTCAVSSRDTEPMDILVASLDDGIVQQKLRDLMVANFDPCCVKFVLPADPQDEPIVASLGADFLPTPLPVPSHVYKGRPMLLSGSC